MAKLMMQDSYKKKGVNLMQKQIYENWTKIDGEKIEDLESYIFQYMKTRDDISIMIGTDASLKEEDNKKKRINYLTVICFKKGNNGCHVIKRRSEEIKYGFVSTAEKLNGEINRTADLALYFREKIGIEPEVHLDVNPSEKAGSFEVYKYIHGYFEALGFVCEYKSNSVAASFAADYFL